MPYFCITSYDTTSLLTIKIHYSFAGFVENHLCKRCVILQSRVLLGVCHHQGDRLAARLITNLYQGQHGDANQSVHGNYKTRF